MTCCWIRTYNVGASAFEIPVTAEASGTLSVFSGGKLLKTRPSPEEGLTVLHMFCYRPSPPHKC